MLRFENTYKKGVYKTVRSYLRSDNKVEEDFYTVSTNTCSIMENNDTVEVIHNIISQLNSYDYPIDIKFDYRYDSKIGSFEMLCNRQFQFKDGYHNLILKDECVEFLKFLNQSITYENVNYLQTRSVRKEFKNNVWNRKQLFFHASFSNCNRKYIGCNKDFWTTPTKLFLVNNQTEFDLHFTTDGKQRITPRHSSFIVELIYAFNTNTVEITR